MTREIKSDFSKLEKFIKNYSISHLLDNDEFVKSLRRQHKSYLALATFFAELIDLNEENNVSEQVMTSDIINYLSESISDIGNALFCSINGAYKPARLALRCSIENFIRSVGSFEDSDLINETSVYRLFERAGGYTIFTSINLVNKSYREIHSNYRVLCADVHTSDKANMTHLSALNFFPHFDKDIAYKTEKMLTVLAKAYLSVLCLLFKNSFHLMHHRNRENILNPLTTPVKKYMHGLVE